jgi:putative nucleotidyltransferase with HDIG domain
MIFRRLEQAPHSLLGRRWVWCAVYLLGLLPLTIGPRLGGPLEVPRAGTTAEADIRASVPIEVVDPDATRARRQAARDAVAPVYDLDRDAEGRAHAFVRDLFARGRRAEPTAGLPPRAQVYLEAGGFAAPVEARLQESVREAFERPIAAGRRLLPLSGTVVLREMPGGRSSPATAPLDAVTPEEARSAALQALARAGAPEAERAALEPLIADLLVPNLLYNAPLTESRRAEAEARVEPLVARWPAGRTIVHRGEIVDDAAGRTLHVLNATLAARRSIPTILGHLLLLGLLLFFIDRYVFIYQKSYRRARELFALLVVVTVAGLALDRGFIWLIERVASTLTQAPFNDPALYRPLVPVATGTMLITLLVSPRAGMAFVLFLVPLLGLLTEWDLRSLLLGLLSSLAAIYGITTYRRRSVLIRAGLLLGGINAVSVLALRGVAPGAGPASHVWFEMCCGLAGGIVVSVLVSFLLPLLESTFNILTDVRLLELSNLANPLLRRLALESPGSYHHSVIVGTLAEAAAESIGANALFCRVAAYYHDVGKLVKPAYYVENQKQGENRHDRLKPHLSALVIASHVRLGIDLARAHGVPREILDIIPQHHGTRRINYFYQKARRIGSPQEGEVREADFRYPGPRPQSREAALLMLADSIEAAARSLDDPQPARLKGVVNTIVSDVVLDDQFSECDLSFSDLERVRAAFFKALCSIHHHRIDYPGFDFGAIEARPFRASATHDVPPADAG